MPGSLKVVHVSRRALRFEAPGFLDKLFGRKKSEPAEGMRTAPPPASMPTEDVHEPSHDEDERADEHKENDSTGGAAT